MTPTEQPYKDREITIRDRETVKLSELTKDERDIYFAGVNDGDAISTKYFGIGVLISVVLIVVILLIIN